MCSELRKTGLQKVHGFLPGREVAGARASTAAELCFPAPTLLCGDSNPVGIRNAAPQTVVGSSEVQPWKSNPILFLHLSLIEMNSSRQLY